MHKRILCLASLLLGVIGMAACTAAVLAVFFVRARLEQLCDSVFGAVSDSTSTVQQRLSQTQDRVTSLKITAEDITQGVQEWAKTEARDRLTLRLGLEQKAERLSSGLAQVDQWLELSESAVQFVQRTAERLSAAGIALEIESPERLSAGISTLREQLAQTKDPVERIRGYAADLGSEDSREEKRDQIVELALRVIATLSSIDSRLENLSVRLAELSTQTRSAQATLVWWTQAAALGIAFLIGWMAAGQVALCYVGWKGLRRGPVHDPTW